MKHIIQKLSLVAWILCGIKNMDLIIIQDHLAKKLQDILKYINHWNVSLDNFMIKKLKFVLSAILSKIIISMINVMQQMSQTMTDVIIGISIKPSGIICKNM